MGMPWVEFYGICRYLNGGEDRRSAFDEWARNHPQGGEIFHLVGAISPALVDYPEPKESDPATDTALYVDVPDLPNAARLSPTMERLATESGRFVAEFSDYVHQVVNTLPREMSEAAALTILSIAVARRLYLPTYFEDIYPILWTLWVAPSTVFHKTTALNLVRRLVRDIMPWLLLPEESSNDRLIQNMAGLKPVNWEQLKLWDQDRLRHGWRHAAQRGIVVDEASSLFGSFDKEYNRGKIETFLRAFDCADEVAVETNKHGIIYMRYLYMPLLGATTPTSIQFANNTFMWESGFWPRFVVLAPERMFPDRPHRKSERIHRPPALGHRIRQLLQKLPEPGEQTDPAAEPSPPPQLAVTMDQACWEHWLEYRDTLTYVFQNPKIVSDNRIKLMYGRLPVKLLRAAMLLAADDWPEGEAAPRITEPHYARAFQIAEQWRINAHRFVEIMNQPPQGEDLERRLLKTIEHMIQDGRPTTTRELARVTHWPRETLNSLLAQMNEDGLLELVAAGKTRVWRPK
jgi:hypothetical protein